MTRLTVSQAGGAHICAALDTIAWSEIGAALLTISDDGYNVLVGSTPKEPKLFPSYTDHPRIKVDLPGIGVVSSAAGRYQQIARTWDYVRMKLALSDFSPANQDRAGIQLIREAGAIPHLLAGNIRNAIEVAAAFTLDAPVWASLPGAGYGQHENHMLDLLHVYGAALAHYESLADFVREAIA